MALIVADASVVVKWLVAQQGEVDVERALRLLRDVQAGEVHVVQPPHWLAEAAAVVARLTPSMAERKVSALHAMGLPVRGDLAVLLTATRLAVETGHHLFDTLYHAVALESVGGVLVTADERYLNKARGYGGIVPLSEYARA